MRRLSILSATALAVGSVSIFAALIPGVLGMLTIGLTGTAAIILGTITIVRTPRYSDRTQRAVGIVAIALGTLGLSILWVTQVIVAAFLSK